jgi:hypothetical protein
MSYFWQLLAAATDNPYRQQLYKIRALGLTQSHYALQRVATLAPEELDIALRTVPPRSAFRGRGGRHRAALWT